MIISKRVAATRSIIDNQRDSGLKIGYVPTMGALHDGHLTLIRKSKAENDYTVCSIFVNPKQFNNLQDLKKYPVSVEKDIELLEAEKCDLLFLPNQEEIYPNNFKSTYYELGHLEKILEGHYRPGHFQGVCQVVDILLSIIHCHNLYLGQKDYQQCMVIDKMIEMRGHHTQTHIIPTVREKSGLAMSSRNERLNSSEKLLASEIYSVLKWIRYNLKAGSLSDIKKTAEEKLLLKGFKPDYVTITDTKLNILEEWNGNDQTVALIAAYLNEVRLIDNMTLN
ncbi:MAG: pantoate--beta-alanine ligase [Ferruginibacter sp.]|nr:pantoate--beta-alanine ligase [Ferruginibacter sp.]